MIVVLACSSESRRRVRLYFLGNEVGGKFFLRDGREGGMEVGSGFYEMGLMRICEFS